MVKNDVFSDGWRSWRGLFVRLHMRQSCLGCIVEVFCVVGMQEMRIPTLKCRIYLFVGWGTCTYTGSKGSFFRCLEVLEGTFVRTYMSQSCLGCIVEGFLQCGQVMVPNRFGDKESRTCVLGRKSVCMVENDVFSDGWRSWKGLLSGHI